VQLKNDKLEEMNENIAKLNITQQEYVQAFNKLEDKAREMQSISDVLNQSVIYIDNKRSETEQRIAEVQKRIEQAIAIEQENINRETVIKNIREEVKNDNKRNELKLYAIREEAVDLYDFYIDIKKKLEDLANGKGIELRDLNKSYDQVRERIVNIEDSFKKTFSITPEQYKRTRNMMN
jgi:hypothetical protein